MDLSFGPFQLLTQDRRLVGPSGPVELSGRSFDLLEALLGRPDGLFTKAELLDSVWAGVAVEENTLHVHMSALRKALGQGFIATVHGRGYRYVGPAPAALEAAGEPATPAGGETNLKRYRVECVARDAERAEITGLIGRHHLVSILGPGGVGKTTVALAVASSVAADFESGVWIIDLAPLADGRLVESTIIQTLGIPFRANATPMQVIADHIGDKDILLVLDNCEHVAPAVAQLAQALLKDAPNLKIIATTQVPLGIPDERVFKLAPFALGDSDFAQAAQFLTYCYEALGEKLEPAELAVVARLCRRLDGVALALKMAAARAATLGIEAVDRQLGEQIEGLAAGWEPSLERHRSLMASLNWSYDLLSERDRRTLRSLGVFQGTFTLDGARAVAGEGADDSVSELARRSIVVRDGSERSRYRLLETTRAFALERLAASGEGPEVRTRHAAYTLSEFRAGLERWETTPDREWLASLQPDADNLRSALEWSRSQQDWPVHVGLAANSYRFWIQTQLPAEGLRACESALEHEAEVPEEVSALLHLALADLYRFYRLDYRVLDAVGPAIAYYETSGNPVRLAQAVLLKGTALTILLREEEARAMFDRADALTAAMPQSKLKARTLVAVALSAWAQGDKVVARSKLEAGLAMHVATGNQRGYFKSTMFSAEVMHREGDIRDAIETVMRALPEVRQYGNVEEYVGQIDNLAVYLMAVGDYEGARPLISECAARMSRDDKNTVWCIIQNAAELASHDGALETAAMLLGFADAGFDSWEDGRQFTESRQRERVIGALTRAGMSGDEQNRLLARGRAMSLFEAEVLAGFAGAPVKGRATA